MTIELKPESQRVIDLAIRSGAYHNPDEVIETALSMLAEDLKGAISESRRQEPRSTSATRQAANLVELSEPIRGLLTDEEVDTLFRRNPSTGRPIDLG